MTGTERSGYGVSGPYHRTNRSCRTRSLRFSIFLLFAFGLATPALAAELQVRVSDTVFLVKDGVVSRLTGTDPIDDLTAQKAIFAARVLDQQILNSSFNRELFSAVNRANVIADQASGRLIEPWRRVLLKAS